MKTLLLTLAFVLAVLCLAFPANAQGKVFVSPSLSHGRNYNAGLSVGLEGINNATIAIGFNQHKYFKAVQLSTVVYLFGQFGVNGRIDVTNDPLRNREITKGENITCKCTGKVLGKKPDFWQVSSPTRLFSTLGLSYKLKGFRLFSDITFNDYDYSESPYGTAVKGGIAYNFNILTL